ncbi:hypothetical protein [Haloferula chungangensis]|uniref:hypothetical protein n=1 Tax=Haloferula chungangensis TaxID=1048331 RepID=UPI0036D29B67
MLSYLPADFARSNRIIRSASSGCWAFPICYDYSGEIFFSQKVLAGSSINLLTLDEMKRELKKFGGVKCSGLIGLSLTLAMQAAGEVAEIEFGSADLSMTQADSTTGKMAMGMHFVKASLQPGAEYIVPLGEFRVGYHQLMIGGQGHSANSSALCEFSVGYNSYAGYNNGHNIRFHLIRRFNWQSKFSVYFKQVNPGVTNLYLHFTNDSPGVNFVHVNIMSPNPGSWKFVEDNSELELDDLTLAEPTIEMNRGQSPLDEDWGGGVVEATTEIDGRIILRKPQGDISMGIYGE